MIKWLVAISTVSVVRMGCCCRRHQTQHLSFMSMRCLLMWWVDQWCHWSHTIYHIIMLQVWWWKWLISGFPHSCNNVLLLKVTGTWAIKIKWPLNMCLQGILLQELEVLLFQVLVPEIVKVSSWNIILPAYSNVRPEMNQISHLQFCMCTNLPVLYCYKNEENGVFLLWSHTINLSKLWSSKV